ncbi:MAG: ribonuclease R [Vicingaceae bacterium]|nr:MAG: ribonuclease R [Vicingaceae bacterium]
MSHSNLPINQVNLLFYKNLLKDLFADHPEKTFNIIELYTYVGAKSKPEKKIIRQILKELKRENIVQGINRGVFRLAVNNKQFTGTYHVYSPYHAVFIDDLNLHEIRVKNHKQHTALHGDKVEAKVKKNKKGTYAIITKVLERKKDQFTGVYHDNGSHGFVSINDNKVNVDFYIPKENKKNAKNKDVVLVRLVAWDNPQNKPVGKIIEVIGKPGVHETEIHTILADFGLPYRFPKNVEKAAAQIPDIIPEKEISKRKDFRDITTFTIDPEDAKDFDDALSIRRLTGDLYEIGVHIADVTYYVKPGDIIDQEAQKRATSVYLVDRVVPMLPEKLSNELCSLRPNEDKLTFSVVFQMDTKGHVHNYWIGRTIIHSDRRFTYEDVQKIIETQKGPFAGEIKILDDIAKILRQNRFKNGSILFDKSEVKFTLDKNNEPTGVYFKVMKDANHLIEEFMLLANKTVAEFFEFKVKKPKKFFVFRVHDAPVYDKLEEFNNFVKRFGYKISIHNPKDLSKSFNRLLEEVKNKPEQDLIEQLAIRTMAKAYYSTENIGHYGLAFDYYTHFTSPIRRYPDVMVHRLLNHYLTEEGKYKKKDFDYLCKHSSDMEKVAMEAERASIKYMQAKYMLKQKGEIFDAIITGVTEWGIYAEILDNKCEGMIRIRSLDDDYYYYDSDNYRLIGKKFKKTFQLGQKIKVRVKEINLEKKQIEFELI